MLKRREYIDKIIHYANKFALDIESYNKSGLLDINKYSEPFYIPVLNKLFDLNLTYLETIERDFPAVDLGDYENRVAFQITSTKSSSKIISTLQTFFNRGLNKNFDCLYILIITKKGQRYDNKKLAAFNSDVFNFSSENILDKDDLIRKITSISNLDKLKQVYQVYEDEFGNSDKARPVLEYSSKEAFRKSFSSILEDPKSVYYNELKEHWNSNSLIENCPFLESLIVKDVSIVICFGLIPIVSEYAVKHLHNDKNFKYVYNQIHIYSHFSEEEGHDLHLFFHLRFIGLLYSTAMWNKVDIGRFKNGYSHMYTIFSGMINAMIDNMDIDQSKLVKEYPSNYHWMIGEIFSIMGYWLETFGAKEPYCLEDTICEYPLFSRESSYLDFIPSCISFSLNEMYKGYQIGKISDNFIARQLHFHVFGYYFNWQAKGELQAEIENTIIKDIPLGLMDVVLSFTLDERFAMSISSFKDRRFYGANVEEKAVVKRLWMFLNANNLL